MQKQIEDLIVKIKRRIKIKFTLCKGHLALRINQSISHKVIENDDLNIAGTYYTLADDRIIRVFIGPSGKEMYSFVKGIPKPQKVEEDVESESKWAGWISTTLDFIPVVSNIKGIAEFAIGKDILTGREFSNVERGIVFAAIFGGPIAKGVTKGGKAVFSLGGKALDKMKNVLHPEKVKKLAKDVFEDYIKSPLNQVTTFTKDIGKKIGDIQTPFANKFATSNGNMNVQKTVSELVQDMKESTIQMAKKMDEKIGGKGKNNDKEFTQSKFKYKNNPMDNPKAAKDIIENPTAVYGFSPNPKSESIGGFAEAIDWTNPEQVAVATARRQDYHDKNDNIIVLVNKMKNEGNSIEDIAKAVNNQRNQNRLNDYIDDPRGLERVMSRNETKYGNQLGPTAEYLYEKYGSWEKVIEKSMSANPGMDACCGLYDNYYHLYDIKTK